MLTFFGISLANYFMISIKYGSFDDFKINAIENNHY